MLLTHTLQMLEKYVKILCPFDVLNMTFLVLISASKVAEIIQESVQFTVKAQSIRETNFERSAGALAFKSKKKKKKKKKTPKMKRADAVN